MQWLTSTVVVKLPVFMCQNKLNTECYNVCLHCLAFYVSTWIQPPVTFPIGDHIYVLHDYKKTEPSEIFKLLSCRCHHLIDMLVELCQNHIFLILLKWLNEPCPSMFTNFCINYYAHVPCGETLPKILPPIEII